MSDLEALPPLNGLRAFCAAGRHLNFRLAAGSLGVTQSAVAQQVRGLEDQLGTPLFSRGARGLAFTEAGRGFHRQIEAAFLRVETATQRLRGDHVKVRLATTPELAARWLMPQLSALSAALPHVDTAVLAAATPPAPGPAADLTLVEGTPPFDEGVDALRLASGVAVAVCAPFALSARRWIRDGAPLLHAPGTSWEELLPVAAPPPGRRVSGVLAAIEAALAGDGVALVPRFLVADALAQGRLVQPIQARQETGRDLYLLSAHPGAGPAAVREWLSDQAWMAAPDPGPPRRRRAPDPAAAA